MKTQKFMKKRSVKENNGGVRAFYLTAFIYAILSILAVIILKWREGSTGLEIKVIYVLATLYALAILIWSIVAWAVFVKNKASKKTLVLPIYYIAMMIVTFMIGFIYVLATGEQLNSLNWEWVTISILSSLFEAVYASYILKRSK